MTPVTASRAALVALVAALSAPAAAQDVALEPLTFEAQDFALESGATLETLVVQYATLGEADRDAEGRIINAVIVPHGWSGDYAQTVTLAKDLVGAGKPIDTDRFHVIFPTALGSPGSSAPSTSGPGPDFPDYTIGDMVATQRALLDHLGVAHLRGVVGISMGGFQTLAWVTKYPDMMDWAIPIAASPSMKGRNLGVFGLMSHQITSDPAYMDGRYEEQPREAMRRGFMSTYLFYFGPGFYDANFTDVDAAVKGLQNAGLGSEKMDANDIVWRNKAMFAYDVSDALPEARVPMLVIGTLEDELFPPEEELKPIAYAAPAAKVFTFSSPLGHVGSAVHIGRADAAIRAFLERVDGEG